MRHMEPVRHRRPAGRRRVIGAIGAVVLAASVAAAPPALANEPVVVLASDFEDGTTQGWFGRGSATVDVSTDAAHSGDASLLTTGRADTWQGPGRDLRSVLQAGATYEIEAFVRLADAPSGEVHLTMQRTPAGGDTVYERVVSNAAVTDGDWARLTGSYTFDSLDNDELQLYLESPDPEVSLFLDDVTITMTSPPPGGPSETLLESDFEDGTVQGWGARGEETVAATQDDARSGEWSLAVTGRTEPWNGPARDITALVSPGKTYRFSLFLKLAPDQEPADLRVSVQTDVDGDSTFQTLVDDTTVGPDAWVEFAGTYTPTREADAIHLYAESASELVDFYLDDFVFSVDAPLPIEEDIPSLKDVLADHFPIGVAIDSRETVGAPAELLTKHFNSITAENHMKPETIQPAEGEFDFGPGDELVAFAEANGLRVYGHTLVWHSQTPDWFFEDADGNPLTNSPEHQQLLLDRMETHIRTVAAHYGDRIWAWDVVNEVIDESQDDGMRRSRWYEILGPDYVAHAFRIARDAFGPDVKLFINDYNTEFPAKREAMYQLVSRLLADGVPVDGIGHQLHVNLSRPISWVEDSIERFADLGVVQAVTELDVSVSESSQESLPRTPPERLIRQGYYYRDLFEVLRAHGDKLVSVTVWGLYDTRSWLRTWPIDRPHEAPLLFDDRLQSKPAYWGIVDPSTLPHLSPTRAVPGGTVQVDGEREVQWDLQPDVVLRAGDEGQAATTFQTRWDTDHLYVLVDVADSTVDAGDKVELYLDDTNAKAGDYQPGDAHYTVSRDGTVDGDATAAVSETDDGYRVEVALPLITPGDVGREVGFDLRITDGSTGEQISWSDLNHGQDTDTSRWGTLHLIEPVAHVDIPRAATSPVVDGEIDPVWETAAVVRTEVLVEGSADGAKADVRLLWDDQRLYVLAEVADPHLDEANSNAWEQDSVEIFVDPDNTKSGAYKSHDGQYRVSFTNHRSFGGDPDVIEQKLDSATAVTDDGYLVEASIELNSMTVAPGAYIGLELQVNDATDGARTAVHTWHDPTGLSYQDTTRWGVGRLVEPEPPAPTCDRTVEGTHLGPLTVTSGVLCLMPGSTVMGPLTVSSGASLIADGTQVLGTVTTDRAASVTITDSVVLGTVTVKRSTGEVTVSGNEVLGVITVDKNTTGDNPIVVSGNTLLGLLTCQGNKPAPVNNGVTNHVLGFKDGQCRKL